MPPLARACTVFALLSALAGAGGCTWVEMTDAARDVRVLTAADGAECERVGRISAATRDHVIGLNRPRSKVRAELERLARNEAARIGGNAVVPLETPTDGRQAFAVWRCPADR